MLPHYYCYYYYYHHHHHHHHQSLTSNTQKCKTCVYICVRVCVVFCNVLNTVLQLTANISGRKEGKVLKGPLPRLGGWAPGEFIMPRPTRWGIKRWSHLSVHLCRLPNPKLTMAGHNKLKISRTEAHYTGDPRPHLEVERSEVKVVSLQIKTVSVLPPDK